MKNGDIRTAAKALWFIRHFMNWKEKQERHSGRSNMLRKKEKLSLLYFYSLSLPLTAETTTRSY
jgi:hypothetical protein